MSNVVIKRTTTSHSDFQLLIQLLDYELWNELNEDQAIYDQFNKVPDIETSVIVYVNNDPAACGCFKEYAPGTIEVKRMFVKKNYRGQGLSKIVLQELETWAKEKEYAKAILETSIYFGTAKKLYESNGYTTIDNYGPYVGLVESVCMGKKL